jgi:hypothetical protein
MSEPNNATSSGDPESGEDEQTVEISVSSLYELKKCAERELTVKPEGEWVGDTRSDVQEALVEANSLTRKVYGGNW